MFFNLTPTTKIAPKGQKIALKGPKNYKGGPKCGRIKNKKMWLYFQNQSWLSTEVGSKNVFEPDPTTKIAQKNLRVTQCD